VSDIVFILGAGASADAGAPLMADFLDRARDWMDSPDGRGDRVAGVLGQPPRFPDRCVERSRF
jgi:hypothetical protein